MQLLPKVIEILLFLVALIWMLVTPQFEQLIAVLVGLLAVVRLINHVPKTTKTTETLDQRNRRVMLNHVENFWIKGVLEKSLHGAALLELGIKEDPTAVNYPWGIKRESTGETLPEGKSMLEIFEEIGMGRSLLILGAPGSGKTTMLLELARQLIERARQDKTEPIPVVFNLASWNEKQTLVDWLTEQLNTLYNVPKRTAHGWVNDNRMLLLLDGLDEVKQCNREDCVNAINQFRSELGLTSMAVCSRIKEYEDINRQLAFDGAVIIQPLTGKQVNAYFEKFGENLKNLKQLLIEDKVLRELSETPLMLSILALAYKDASAENIRSFENTEDHRKHIFNTYIERMFERFNSIDHLPFSKLNFFKYLNWLARKMIEYDQNPIFVERLQPTWGDTKKHNIIYRIFISIVEGAFYTLVIGILFDFQTGIIIGMLGGLISGILLNRGIKTIETLHWSWKTAIKGMRIGCISALLIGLIGGLVIGFQSGWYQGLGAGIGLTIVGGTIWGLNQGLTEGLIGSQLKETTAPGQGLRLSLKNAFISFFISGIIFGIFLGIFGKLDIAVAISLTFFSIYGGNALAQHFVLRLVLLIEKQLPWQLISFLNYATQAIYLRKVGGGYIFIHHSLMEHFAEMDFEKIESSA